MSISAQIHVIDNNGNLLDVNPNTSIANVSGLQSELNGKVSKVKVGSTAYNPSSGVVSLPAYPTTLPASDVSSWAKASSKPSYTQDEVGDGTTYKRVSATEKTTWDNKGTYSKPSGGIPKTDLASAVQTSLGKADTALQSFTETDPTVPAWAKASSKPTYTAAEVGLGNVGNFKAVSTVASQGLTNTEKSNARANIGAGTSSFSGSYNDLSNKPTIPTKTSQLTNDSGYTTNTGTVTGVKVGSTSYSPSSGVVSLPAYPTSLPASDVYSWAKASSKPTYTASEVGLGNVGNFKAVSTVASQGLSSTEQSNARANIGAGTSSFSGSYNDLSNKPTIPTKVSQLTNDSGYTTNTGTVTGVKVGSTSYSPSSGIVSLPAYPTTLPANGGTAANVSGTVAIANGGTGATSASAARTNLGLGSAATKSATSSITSGSSALITSGAVYTALKKFDETSSGDLTSSMLDSLEDGDVTGWLSGTIGPITQHLVTVKTRSHVNGSTVHKIQSMTSANGYEMIRKYSPDTGWVPWSGFGSVDASINLSQLTFTKTYSGNGWFYSGNIDYSTYFRNIYSAMIYDFNFVLCKLGINVAIDSASGTKCYLLVSDPDNPSSLSFNAAATLDIRLFGMRLY